jgi:hypothetical protein
MPPLNFPPVSPGKILFWTTERPKGARTFHYNNSGGTSLVQRTPRNKEITYESLVFVEMKLLKDLGLHCSPSSSPLRSKEFSMLQPWTKTGTRPLFSDRTKHSAPELKEGLPMEARNSLEHTGIKQTILATCISVLCLDAE